MNSNFIHTQTFFCTSDQRRAGFTKVEFFFLHWRVSVKNLQTVCNLARKLCQKKKEIQSGFGRNPVGNPVRDPVRIRCVWSDWVSTNFLHQHEYANGHQRQHILTHTVLNQFKAKNFRVEPFQSLETKMMGEPPESAILENEPYIDQSAACA